MFVLPLLGFQCVCDVSIGCDHVQHCVPMVVPLTVTSEKILNQLKQSIDTPAAALIYHHRRSNPKDQRMKLKKEKSARVCEVEFT